MGAGAGAGTQAVGRVRRGRGPPPPEGWRDWGGGLPADVLGRIAETHVAQTEAGWAARRKEEDPDFYTDERIQERLAERKQEGNCLLVFALVCREWRKAQLRVGGPLRSRAVDVILPGSAALAKWALTEGCPRERGDGFNIAYAAAEHGHLELVQWLCGEGGFALNEFLMQDAARGGSVELVQWLSRRGCPQSKDLINHAAECGRLEVVQFLRGECNRDCPGCPWLRETLSQAAWSGNLELVQWLWAEGCPLDDGEDTMGSAARSGNLQLVQWLRGKGCPWDQLTCHYAVHKGHAAVLRWARENGCPWEAQDRDRAAAELGYTDDFGNSSSEWE